MAGTAGLHGIVQQPWETSHAGMCVVLCTDLIVATMAQRAVVRSERMCRGKTRFLGKVAIVATVTVCGLPERNGSNRKTQKNQGSASHIEIVNVLMLI